MKAYHAYAKGCGVTADSPRAAAQKFFASYPTKRKCDITEGEINSDGFFTVSLGMMAANKLYRADDVTKSQVDGLPDSNI